jgi:tripartite-type tricarboxylate transporter receptor subunit TctC
MIAAITRPCLALVVAIFAVWPRISYSQEFPGRPLKIVVGFAPGGSSDMAARAIADLLPKQLGQSVIVENKPGAGGLNAADQVAKSLPDGYTLLLVASAHAVTGAMRRQLPFDPVSDFTWLSTLVSYGMVYGVRSDSPYKSLGDLISAARTAPRSLSYYSFGVGTAHHLLGEWLNAATGIELVHVPYRGSSQALSDFVAGRVDLMIDTMTFALPQAEGGNLRALAVTSRDRPGLMAEVPFSGSLVEGLEYESWLGLAAPKNLPPDVAERLAQATREVVRSPEFIAKMSALGATAKESTSAGFRSRVERDIAHFKSIVNARSIGQE